MKYLLSAVALFSMLSLAACSQVPKECNDAWEQMEKLSKQMGMPEDQIKAHQKEFQDNIKGLSKEDAIKACTIQSSMLNLASKQP
ncbi:hypothetical protein [Acinetobacter sp. ANC 3813]|uniref:hypothetical protein n=1 Tax=Acinetobacter sp. ANC 3813 TaxID=1977873 RepID=UPI000A3483D6|nr:hypothetical protein [Acinetobacter sp. ANC 3813]OTG91497.1 hypothetical protein B9T34_04100 [Acinetobacter sp. ANC 3813]